MTQTELTTALERVMPQLSSSWEFEFATSILRQARTRFLSEKQMAVARKIINKIESPTVAPQAAVGDLKAINELFDRARKNLKFPAIVLAVPELNESIRINVAGAKSKAPGSLNVCKAERTIPNDFGTLDREWYGRVGLDGVYTGSRKHEGKFAAITARLQAFAADPVGVAAEHGKLTGACCFCNRPLTDERSTAVGYGKKCAENFGLSWGRR